MMKKKVLTDLKVTCDPPSGWWFNQGDIMQRAKRLDEWARDFNDFIRDHRSQDAVDITIERVYEEQCEFCRNEWELDTDGVPTCCQAAIEEYEKEQS